MNKQKMNKKGTDQEELIKIISWIAFFALVLVGIIMLAKRFFNT